MKKTSEQTAGEAAATRISGSRAREQAFNSPRAATRSKTKLVEKVLEREEVTAVSIFLIRKRPQARTPSRDYSTCLDSSENIDIAHELSCDCLLRAIDFDRAAKTKEQRSRERSKFANTSASLKQPYWKGKK